MSGDKSAAKYSEMSAILGVLGYIWPNPFSLTLQNNLGLFFYGEGCQKKGHGARIWPKKHKMALISEYLAADLSAGALAIINKG